MSQTGHTPEGTAFSAPQSPPGQVPPNTSYDSSRPKVRLPKWNGDLAEFDIFSLGLMNILANPPQKDQLGDERTICITIFTELPPNGANRTKAWMKLRHTDGAWDSDNLLKHLNESFEDKDSAQRAARRLYAVRQGVAQPFAQYRHVFETYCADADILAPAGASKVNTLLRGLASYLRDALALQLGVSSTDYNSFVTTAQALAIQLEALPRFQANANVQNQVEWYDSSITVDLPANRTNGAMSQAPIRTPATQTQVDRDGDSMMGGVNHIKTNSSADLVSIVQTIVAALAGQQQNGSNRSSSNNNGSGRGKYIEDSRPRAPWVDQTTRDRRSENRQCVRCGKTPSHRYGECQYKSFPPNAPAGVNGVNTKAGNE
jgi:hypothetical protein